MFRFVASLCVLAILATSSFASGIGVGFGLQRAAFASPFYGARLFAPFVPSVVVQPVVQQAVFAQPIVQSQVFAAPAYSQGFAQQAVVQPAYATQAFAQPAYAQQAVIQQAVARQAFAFAGYGTPLAVIGSNVAFQRAFGQRAFIPGGPVVVRSRTVIRR